jgi:hypothetical protein
MGVRNLKTGSARRTKLGLALEQGAKDILAHVKGEARLPARRIVLPDEVDVKRVRTKARMSQSKFARGFASTRGRYRNGSKDGESQMRPPAHISQ